jgi:hypothetical protein
MTRAALCDSIALLYFSTMRIAAEASNPRDARRYLVIAPA